MAAGVAAGRARRGWPPRPLRMHTVARLFAREGGVEPDPARWPALARALLFGPQSPVSFRLEGPDALPGAARRVAEEAAAFGAITGPELTAEEAAQLDALAAVRGDAALAVLAAALRAEPGEPGERGRASAGGATAGSDVERARASDGTRIAERPTT
jgi:hypothetical protein